MSPRPERPSIWRHALVAVVVVAGLAAAADSFWRFDLRYAQPTPRPPHLPQQQLGSRLDLPAAVAARVAPGRPTLLHFFNADCPCSRFNVDHLRALLREHRHRLTVVAVLEGDEAELAIDAFARHDLGIPATFDEGGRIAAACGVYSTPQAVLLAGDGTCFFRGNYNLGRFCVDPASEFAQQAITALLAGRALPAMPPAATIAYGCELPCRRRLEGQ